MSNPSRTSEIDVTIHGLAAGGAGVARHAGQALFVPGGLPGDRVRVRLSGTRAGRREGRLLEVIEPSPSRVPPPCPYAGTCGGCAWLALDAEAQRRARADLVREALRRIGGLEAPEVVPVVAAADTGYRARVEVALGPPGEDGRRSVGFRGAASHAVVDVAHCAVAAPAVNAALEGLRAAAAAGRVPPAVAEVEIAVGDEPARIVATARLARALPPKESARLADRLMEAWPGLAGLRVEPPPAARGAAAVERGEPSVRVCVPGPAGPLALDVPAGGFMQANPGVNGRLVEAVTAAVTPAARVLDLYCGAGNFALPLAAAGAEVLGIETDGRAVDAARRSAARLGLGRARFRQVPVEEGLRWAEGEGAWDAVVLDPPRAGAGPAAMDRLVAMRLPRIAYVSCDPATLARDLRRLGAGGYRLDRVTAFDMFPQTPHVESLAILALGPRPML